MNKHERYQVGFEFTPLNLVVWNAKHQGVNVGQFNNVTRLEFKRHKFKICADPPDLPKGIGCLNIDHTEHFSTLNRRQTMSKNMEFNHQVQSHFEK